jgi:hypothetical protein
LPNYIFTKDPSTGDSYADYDHVNDIQTYYLPDISGLVSLDDIQDKSDIIREFIIQLFSHEDLHECIENSNVDSLASAQHEYVYPLVFNWLSGKDKSELGY